MSTHTFTVLLDRTPTDDEQDRLYEAGLDDAALEIDHGAALLHVDRASSSLDQAILSVVRDVHSAGFRVSGLQQDDLVSLKTIAQRAGRTYESMRLLATGQRGPGGFPAPLSGDGWSLHSWSLVAGWLREHYGLSDAADDYSRTIAVADLMARAQLIAQSGPRRIDLESLMLGLQLIEDELQNDTDRRRQP
ncbi:hypothetical protein [Leifsonia sp. C5G2]|uniref:hypothetical protein n=1 Tax=Leifsonia sp. C5G2 TaxID=2735269 RepID=UPI00158487AF|nr:hypothetical protein [Leifsonia sp. C5G2]NUU05360.1 hypothetical protein [Leifsonia sp. C5G2]